MNPPTKSEPMRLLVTGGRKFMDKAFVFKTLDQAVFGVIEFDFLVQGGATGVDEFAALWAKARQLTYITVPAPWDRLKYARAGPARNQAMLDRWHPNAAVVFPGVTGTADMARRLKAAKVSTWTPHYSLPITRNPTS
jgi:hypothetical protein